MSTAQSPLLARSQALIAALLFSTGGVVIKSITLTAWQVASFRSAVAAVAVLVLMPNARRWVPMRAWMVGVAFGGTMVLYALANRATTAANAIFLQDTSLLWVLLLAPLLLGEHAKRRDLLVMVVLAAGLGLILFGGDAASATAPAPVRGNVLGACAGVCWAFTVMGLRWLERAEGGSAGAAASAVFAGNVLACAVTLPMALPMTAGVPRDWLLVAYLGAVQIALAYVFLTAAVRTISAFEASLLLLSEPVASAVWAWWLLGERPSTLALFGAALILLATAGKTWVDSRAPRPSPAHATSGEAP